jgi:cyclic beta-1,2-glucan synthetase|nr:glucoamylase family protein [uncultured Rhodopila sp.]
MLTGRLSKHQTPASLWDDRAPVRGEFFSIEHLEQHGRSLAAAQPVATRKSRGQALAERLADNAAFLLEANRAIAEAAEAGGQVTPAAEWLIDNYHLVDMQIREIGIDLPAGYYSQLPKLAGGPFAGLPRVFGVAWFLVAHTDSHFDPDTLRRYLLAYQEVQPLTIGELWAVPITLRIVLIENLRRLAAVIADDGAARQAADILADHLTGGSNRAAEPAAAALAAIGKTPLNGAFAVQLAHRLRGQDPDEDPAPAWLDKCLAEQGTTIDIVVHNELQLQGTFNATIRNIINSLRQIAGIDWIEAFESVCLVNAVLAGKGCFLAMDFPTRNLYRTAIEILARGSSCSELDIAHAAVAAASAVAPAGRGSEPGYHLLAGGRRALETAIGFRPPLQTFLSRTVRGLGISGYGTAVVAVAIAFLAIPLWLSPGTGIWWLLLLCLPGFVAASDAAVACVNRLGMWAFGATPLPGLELEPGIPSAFRTIVAVPTLLTTRKAIAEQVARLEVHYLANQDEQLHFVLLSDWIDCPTEHSENDATLLAAAADGIARLNRLHGPAHGGDRFILLHRHRIWNAGEQSWIGWERKRGKLHEFNRLLRGATDTSFLDQPRALPTDVRYVVTLDSDTRLPHDAVRRLVGKLAHPLNAPRFDPESGCVVEGYSVLQPRVTPSLPVGRDSSLFQRVFSNMDGIDPYAAAVSDLYQDIFGEGSYAGKGIYDLDAFEAALADRVPDSTLLSHDLFEGMFARAGLASDIEVIEEFPSDYAVAALRQHRWARGDWQLLPWIAGAADVPAGSTRRRSRIPPIGRWKMLDNLRRSLSAPAIVLAFMAAWTQPFHTAFVWTAFLISTLAVPTLLPVFGDIVPRRQWISLRSYFGVLARGLRHTAILTALNIVFLAHQACLMGDAIIRTLIRVFVTRRHLLQWVTAAQAGDGPRLGMAACYRRMACGPAIGVITLGLAIMAPPGVWLLAVPFAGLWIASPAVAVWASRWSTLAHRFIPSIADIRVMRMEARRTWRFFETFVTPADNMLPPDNYQEDPAPVLARRTSPTNLGLYLLSTVSAHDFGWAGLADTLDRLESTLATMGRMARFRGHFYNWYDTADLRPLEPAYVSTVDSGNLAGHLIALASACRLWRESTRDSPTWRDGVGDALNLAGAECAAIGDAIRPSAPGTLSLETALSALATSVNAGSDFAGLGRQARAVADLARERAAGTGDHGADRLFWTMAAQRSIESRQRDADRLLEAGLQSRLVALEDTARSMALAMEFSFLRNDARKLLSIGFLVAENCLDANCYDLLASEARLAVFVAIAKGDVPAREWFRLGRAVTPVGNGAALVSWSGSMFEYLMPSLVMRAPGGSLLEETSRLIVQRQIDYGQSRGLPWGVSESAYNVRDIEYTYQYSNFGVPGLGLKRGLGHDAVVAPYATLLAAMVDPQEAVRNIARLSEAGALGRYGFHEALDYTPGRVPRGQPVAVVRAFMAHHQGMSILAVADAVLGGIMRSRFHAEPLIGATELLLQERAPRYGAVARRLPEEEKRSPETRAVVQPGGRRFSTARGPAPATHLLSNGRYSVMLTTAGSGYSRWQDLAVTRWREDPTRDDWGSYVYLRDMQSGAVWSACLQPIGSDPDEIEIAFSEDRAEFARRDGSLTTTVEILVSAEDDAEVRRVSISNAGTHTRQIELTSYAELALAPQAADIAHPAFAKLFVQTEYLAESGAILATRRRRTPDEPDIWAAHLVVAEGAISVETDRARFIGRGRGVRDPLAMARNRALSGTVGTVLDAAFSVRCRVSIPPGAVAHVAFWTMAASSRAKLLGCIDKHRDAAAFDRAATLAWTQAQVQLRHLGISPADADLFQRLAGHMLFAGPALRPSSSSIRDGGGMQSGLWGLGISGDLPILLLRISDGSDIAIVPQLLLAHEYFRLKQLAVDLVILNDHAASYAQDLQVSLEALIRGGSRAGSGPGSVFLLRSDLVPPAACALLGSVARVVLSSTRGSLADQLDRAGESPTPRSVHTAPEPAAIGSAQDVQAAPALEFFNGLGGFADDGREYVILLGPGKTTPAPWINVIANPAFGFQASAEGNGYSWAGNSRENQLTPWSNDPVTDRSGEAFYLLDDETREIWCPTAGLRRDPSATYTARHGRGYSRFDRTANGIRSSLLQYVPLADPIKISRLQLHNLSGRARSVSVTAYVEWILGASRSATAAFVTTEIDAETGAMFARNPWSATFGRRVAFADIAGRQTAWTGDRRAFIGRNGSLARPAALAPRAKLSGAVGAGLDPCGALRTTIHLPPGGRAEVVFFLGQGEDADDARHLVTRYRAMDLDAVLSSVSRHWDGILGAVQVRTPDRSMDIMLNGWLLYQTLACRVWARAGFYQASGAFGFRDQLQDGMALTASCPSVVREHLLRAASRQFTQGDVQHWWLPETGMGVRTRISDNCAWLAYTVAQYVAASGDSGVLDEPVTFLEAPALAPGEHDRFFLPATADETASLFDHCARALDHSLLLGSHGLPLMGTGDWNDGMNRVGEAGRGESIWLGWFLHTALTAFAKLADARHDTVHAETWRNHAASLAPALERAWDGDWYLRAYFDDGTPLGSHADAECRIDSIAQSWAVISSVAKPDRAVAAMQAVEQTLVAPDDGLVLVLAPPFDAIGPDPGYIRGYPPGIRENGGQYTHAALWTVMATAALGDGNQAHRLFNRLNPINHTLTLADVARYKVEPYAVVADIYSKPPHAGRGGWSWYTGSAGWMQRVGVESILGVRIRHGRLVLDPVIPKDWPGFEVAIVWRSARYDITVQNPAGVSRGVVSITLDGTELPADQMVTLVDDGASHRVEVKLG